MRVEFEKLSPTARVWVYQNEGKIADEKLQELRRDLDDFVSEWSAHQQPLAAFGQILHDRFLVLMVDEHLNAASGCSIDSSVNFIRSIEKKYGLSLFDRFTFSYQKDGKVFTVPKSRFAELFQSGEIDESTMVFDNLIRTKADLERAWLKPLGKSWHRRFV
ncbi:MAG: hypothetical protein KDC53_10765 [Saprospiraceae bacterium]|nr:hypothetical protein [Saprospiraceae bacterium]